MKETNLTDPMEIRHALERKMGGVGSLTNFAREHGYSVSYISQTISGERSNLHVLELLATRIGQPVHGVRPARRQRKVLKTS
ncbi:MAG: hypothetical protein RBS34_00530 [Desulfofustis sp.]|jgi:hypothetical protein|nr:hypothetical protein [Desulfofustis sp.]